jgi:hypothetical protein
MAKRLSGLARRELIVAVRGRYSASAPSVKREILREFVAITGYHRKSAIRILNDIGDANGAAIPFQVWSRSPLLEVLRGSRFPEEHKKTSELLPLTRQIALWLVVEM